MNNTTSLHVAETILAQLGGARFLAMVGGKNVLGGSRELSLKIGRNAAGVTHVRVELDETDTYTVRFLRVRRHGLDVTDVRTESGVYAEQLRPLFESVTGLRTSL